MELENATARWGGALETAKAAAYENLDVLRLLLSEEVLDFRIGVRATALLQDPAPLPGGP